MQFWVQYVVITQLFSYEVPLFMALLTPALLANTWSLSGITQYYAAHPLYILINIPAFIVCRYRLSGEIRKGSF